MERQVNAKLIMTSGEVFPDGACIERLRGNLMVGSWDLSASGSASLDYAGNSYSPEPLPQGLAKGILLPAGVREPGTLEALMAELQREISSIIAGDDSTSLLLAAFIVATWVHDRLPGPLVANLWGPAGAEESLIFLLSSLCRHSLQVLNPSLTDLSTIPPGLSPTLFVRSTPPARITLLVGALSTRGAGILNRGDWVNLNLPTIFCTRYAIPGLALNLPIAGGGTQCRIKSETVQNLIEGFQPRLLGYRLHHLGRTAESDFDAPVFRAETRMVAATLGAALEGSPVLQTQILESLASRDEQFMVDASHQLPALTLEVLLVACHEDRQSVLVGDVADMLTVLLSDRGQPMRVTAKEVGGILRSQLGLYTRRVNVGYRLMLDLDTRFRIHQLATAHGALSSLQPTLRCALCTKNAEGKPQSEIEVQNIHDVHDPEYAEDVHEVHNVHKVHEAAESAAAREEAL